MKKRKAQVWQFRGFVFPIPGLPENGEAMTHQYRLDKEIKY